MEPALRLGAAVRPEDRFKRERLGARQRMFLDQQRIADAVELDGFADRRFDHFRMAFDLHRQAADLVEVVEIPRDLFDLGVGRIQRRNSRDDQGDQQRLFQIHR